MSFTIATLDASTWEAFAELVERNNGVTAAAGASAITPSAGSGALTTEPPSRRG